MYRFRRLLNTSAQGTVADAVKEAMIAVAAQLGSAGVVILNLHDELVAEVHESSANEISVMLQREMERSFFRAIPGVPVKSEIRICKTLED